MRKKQAARKQRRARAISKPIKWVGMKHEADCWIAACAMAAGTSYNEAENSLGSGADYSAEVLKTDARRLRRENTIHFEKQYYFLLNHGWNSQFTPLKPALQRGKRYLLFTDSADSRRPWMAHIIVVDENGEVFDPDPNYDPNSHEYSIENYSVFGGWEIVRKRKRKS